MPIEIDRSLRLPAGQFFETREEKSGIAIHHTVGGSVVSTFNWWCEDPLMIGTAYIIERDGTIHEVFDRQAWAWQFGLGWPGEEKIAFEKRFVGIELASEGGLKEAGGRLYCFDRISSRTEKPRDESFDYGQDYRGYRFFDRYKQPQLDSLTVLVNALCDELGVERKIPKDPLAYHGKNLMDFRGIIGHAMVRRDKSDPAPLVPLWEQLVRDCSLEEAELGTTGPPPGTVLTEPELDALFEDNVHELDKMNVSAGSMIKGLLMELERGERDTFIRLHDAAPNGHEVAYEFVQGDRGLVFRIGRALGLEEVAESRLKVRGT